MRRTPFKRKTHAPRPAGRQWEGDTLPTPRAPASAQQVAALFCAPLLKTRPVRSEEYRRLVAALPCINCGIGRFSQAAHGPTLGARIKSDDTLTFPLCCARTRILGCHYAFDNYILFPAEQRREAAIGWAAATRATLIRQHGAETINRILKESK